MHRFGFRFRNSRTNRTDSIFFTPTRATATPDGRRFTPPACLCFSPDTSHAREGDSEDDTRAIGHRALAQGGPKSCQELRSAVPRRLFRDTIFTASSRDSSARAVNQPVSAQFLLRSGQLKKLKHCEASKPAFEVSGITASQVDVEVVFDLPELEEADELINPGSMGNKPVKQKQEREEILLKIVPPLDHAYVRWLTRDVERIHGFTVKNPRPVKPPDHYIEYMHLNGWLDANLDDPDLAHLFK
ncbi:hypothetical protein JRO89_XS10G0207600 [Xanthoceras sorbifolium]|uniref:Uncharacterized protein n=1 Tax=Xanthoceras sorbifolium TaxID=99658 RepID=A0ABQ8HJN0_9ROSI|nr:hypothetical protein JRO89_XS10G0207600 [Xanthoceras sorbifolium]